MPKRRNTSSIAQLEEQLTLLAWLNKSFGYAHSRDLLTDMKQAAEGFDETGQSYLYHRIVARGEKVEISPSVLARYDNNVWKHLRSMNARRREPITLRYFQHMAALYTELFLDRYFNHHSELLRSLNAFAKERPDSGDFTEQDLTKLAFWMATGSGKTLVLHLNYRQFLYYNRKPLDNILLITPNEGLSEQHIAEMSASNIPCARFEQSRDGLMAAAHDAVRVIEITKLVEQKRGGGVSVPVEAFEGNNLIFVDEGHKGSGGEAWRRFRDALAETGFTFEYSATFGQALMAARNEHLIKEYGKAIVFDYSYRYFYGDGYGKDFHILNLKEEVDDESTEILLFGNLLSFYEQQLVFRSHAQELLAYNLENPLWVFVGSTVSAVYTEKGERRSDVLTVVHFLHRVLGNEDDWATKTVQKLLAGESGLNTPDGKDVFVGRFLHLRDADLSADHLYRDLLETVFHASASGGLHLYSIRGSSGEIGLKASGARDYFGLIYIGDTSTFKKLVTETSDIAIEEEALVGSLFDGIGNPETTINVLIGAKKFMEGWNSWRVSNMGLLKVGSQEGSEIIQLFGRGVRLRGRGFSLKRSAALDGQHPSSIGLLETLNIFSVKANYMSQFRAHLEREEIEDKTEIPLKVQRNKNFLNTGLLVPRVPDGTGFMDEEAILLEPDANIHARVDLSPRLEIIASGSGSIKEIATWGGGESDIPKDSLKLVDWQKVYLEMLDYVDHKGYYNISFGIDSLREILAEPTRGRYSLIADESVVAPTSFAGTESLYGAVVSVLKKYVDKFYRARRERYDSNRMIYEELTGEDANFRDYLVRIPRSQLELIDTIQTLIEQADEIYDRESIDLPRIRFDRHLYQPLLLETSKIESDPPGLKGSERQFVDDLRKYCLSDQGRDYLENGAIYLLRNLGRGRGVGFFTNRGFYPDFIMWIKKPALQRIIFIEPHGMLHAGPYKHDEKARLHEKLPDLASEISARSGHKNVELDSFIISATSFEELVPRYDDGLWNRERFAKEAHILFPDDNYLEKYILT